MDNGIRGSSFFSMIMTHLNICYHMINQSEKGPSANMKSAVINQTRSCVILLDSDIWTQHFPQVQKRNTYF